MINIMYTLLFAFVGYIIVYSATNNITIQHDQYFIRSVRANNLKH